MSPLDTVRRRHLYAPVFPGVGSGPRRTEDGDLHDDLKPLEWTLKAFLGGGEPPKEGKVPDKLREIIDRKAAQIVTSAAVPLHEARGRAIVGYAGGAGPSKAERAAMLKMIYHLYMIGSSGSQVFWAYAPPDCYSKWIFSEVKNITTDAGLVAVLGRAGAEVYSATPAQRDARRGADGQVLVPRRVGAQFESERGSARPWCATTFPLRPQPMGRSRPSPIASRAGFQSDGRERSITAPSSSPTNPRIDRAAGWNDFALAYIGEAMCVIYVQGGMLGKIDQLQRGRRQIAHASGSHHRPRNLAQGSADRRRDLWVAGGLKPEGSANLTPEYAIWNADSWAYYCVDLKASCAPARHARPHPGASDRWKPHRPSCSSDFNVANDFRTRAIDLQAELPCSLRMRCTEKRRRRHEIPPGYEPATEVSLAEAVMLAIAMHRANGLDDAEKLYERILRSGARERRRAALHGRAAAPARPQRAGARPHPAFDRAERRHPRLAQQSRQRAAGNRADGRGRERLRACRRASRPSGPTSRTTWACCDCEQQRPADAEAAYRRAIELDPKYADAHTNLGRLLQRQERMDEALLSFCEAVVLTPAYAKGRRALGMAYQMLGRLDDAVQAYRDWLKDEPGNPEALHYLAACSGDGVPDRAPDAYIETVFDGFANSFDAKLAMLDYRAPALVAETVASLFGEPARELAVLDAGCGTGLCGPLLAPYARRLDGVDLSEQMLAKARARNVYDALAKAELTAFIDGAAPASYDLIVSADTLCYFGDLRAVARAAAKALRPAGWLVFTVEAAADAGEAGFRLNPHGRYSHRRDATCASVLAGAGLSRRRDPAGSASQRNRQAGARLGRLVPVRGRRLVAAGIRQTTRLHRNDRHAVHHQERLTRQRRPDVLERRRARRACRARRSTS